MKQTGRILFTAVVLLCSLLTSAQTKVEIDGIWYNLDSNVKQAEVTYKGSSYDDYDNEYSGHIAIPTMVPYKGVNYSVTSIGESTFGLCEGLTSITIPETVKSIGYGAFYECDSLTAVHITDITAWCCIEFGDDDDSGIYRIPSPNPLYYAHNLYLNGELITELTIPNTISRIKKYAFHHCRSITSVNIPESITSIGEWAFGDCDSLAAVHIADIAAWCNIRFSDNPLEYAHNLYMDGKLVTELAIPNTITAIKHRTFSGCESLTSIIIPSSVTSIGWNAFSDCSRLESITIPECMTSIGGDAFRGCSNLAAVHITDLAAWCNIGFDDYGYANPLSYGKGNLYLNGTLVTELTVPSSVNIIKGEAFYGCSSLISVTIPTNVDSIGGFAFSGCRNLKIIDTGNACVASNAFSYCKNIEYLALNSPCVGDCFMNLPMLKEVVLGNKVERCISFSGCENLERATLYCSNIGDWFSGNDAVKNIILGEGVITVEEKAFRFCSGLTSIVISDDVVTIGDMAFNLCTSLREVCFKDGNETLTVGCNTSSRRGEGKGLFYECPLEKVYLGRNLNYDTSKGAGYSPFYNKETLTSLINRPEVTEVGEYAFSGCGLESITCYAVVSPTCYESTFAGVDTSIPVYVPKASIANFQSAKVWKDFLSFVGVDTGIYNSEIILDNSEFIYDLHGRRITNTDGLKGVYIVNGKKKLIK